MIPMLQRALEHLIRDRKHHATGFVTLTLVFLCLSASLWALVQLRETTRSWTLTNRVFLHLDDQLTTEGAGDLKDTLLQASGVGSVNVLKPDELRRRLVARAHDPDVFKHIADGQFPRMAEVTFDHHITVAQLRDVEVKIAQLPGVHDVDTGSATLEHIADLGAVAQGTAMGFALLVLICVLAVVTHTIRAASKRREEELHIERLCGATAWHVSGPLVLEVVLLCCAATLFALGLLNLGVLILSPKLDPLVRALLGHGIHATPWRPQVLLLMGVALVTALTSLWAVGRAHLHPRAGHQVALTPLLLLLCMWPSTGRATPPGQVHTAGAAPSRLNAVTPLLREYVRLTSASHAALRAPAHSDHARVGRRVLEHALRTVSDVSRGAAAATSNPPLAPTPPGTSPTPPGTLPTPPVPPLKSPGLESVKGDLAIPVTGAVDIREDPSHPERGLLFSARAGAWVRASAVGSVVFVGPHPTAGGPVPTVIVQHGAHHFTVYQGLGNATVSVGQPVQRGSHLGIMGQNPLRFEVRRGTRALDALAWLGL